MIGRKETVSSSDTPGVIAPPPLIALAAIVLGLLLDWLLPAYVLTVLLPFGFRLTVGLVLIGVGLALGIAAIRQFRAHRTHVEPWKPSTAMVTTGVFAWLRNPMYIGIAMSLAGLSILLASDWMLVMTILFMPVIHVGVVRREERYLAAKFGEPYRLYLARVPRYGWPL